MQPRGGNAARWRDSNASMGGYLSCWFIDGIRWESNGNVVLPDLAEAGGLILVDQSVSVFVAAGVLESEVGEDLGN